MGSKFSVYTEPSWITENNLKNLSPIFSVHWEGLKLNAISSGEQNPDSPFVLTNDVSNCDFVALPMHWTYYLWNGKARMHEADALARVASENGKRLVVWFKGDLVPIVPYENAEVFLPGMLRSRAKPNQHACPVFIDDPEPVWGVGEVLIREKKDVPTVGFCGYGSLSTPKLAWSTFRGFQLRTSSYLGRFDYDGIPIVPATVLRNRAIRILRNDSRINTSFVIRDEYTDRKNSGDSPSIKSRAETFYSNIYESDYTLCIRGYGNWSYRFYETLACGRIPVFIDTDCVLPLESKINWREYCVWIDRSELELIGEKILDFHSSLSTSQFVELQTRCRSLWQEHLSLNSCMKEIFVSFDEYN